MISIKKIKYYSVKAGLAAFAFIVLIMLTSLIVRVLISPPVESRIEIVDESGHTNRSIQIEIFNACGVSGIAAQTQNYMRLREFDVLEIGNFKKNLKKSMVLDRTGDITTARKVAYAIGIDDSLVVSKPDSKRFVKCSVVLGDDYKLLKPFI